MSEKMTGLMTLLSMGIAMKECENTEANPYDSKRVDRDILCSSEHMMRCFICGKQFDVRDLSQVVEHEHAGIDFEGGQP